MVAKVGVPAAVIAILSVRVNMLVFFVAIVSSLLGWSGVVFYVRVQEPAPPTNSY
jgi:hypothetical protein